MNVRRRKILKSITKTKHLIDLNIMRVESYNHGLYLIKATPWAGSSLVEEGEICIQPN